MIRHCVFIQFQEQISTADKKVLYDRLEALKDDIAGIVNFQCGANVSPEIGMDKGYADGFIIDFENASARDQYLENPTHRAIGSDLVSAAVGGAEGILVFDLEIS